jgi:hypothetical protein
LPIQFAAVDDAVIEHVPLEDLLERADYVVCLAIANEQTENLIDQAALARIRRHAFFINLSRGNLVEEAALAAALRDNRIAGVAMDVGRARSNADAELAKLPNVIATPHIGGLTPPAIESQSLETVCQVQAIVNGEIPAGAVNADRWTRRPVRPTRCRDGAIAFVFMDWRHIGDLLSAGEHVFSELKNLCVWNKTNGGMGTFYRSKHELIFVFKVGTAPHINTFGLGETGRYKPNACEYAGVNTFRAGRLEDLELIGKRRAGPTQEIDQLVARDCVHPRLRWRAVAFIPLLANGRWRSGPGQISSIQRERHHRVRVATRTPSPARKPPGSRPASEWWTRSCRRSSARRCAA